MADKKTEGGAPADSERNSLKQARPRERQRPPREPAERAGQPVNSIREIPVRQAKLGFETATARASEDERKAAEDPKKASGAERPRHVEPEEKASEGDSQGMPEHVRRRFVQVGKKYYFPDGARAFTDRGHRLTTGSENTEVIKTLVDIAKTRGWEEIGVTGTERFRREAWFTAKMAGLEVRGFRPSAFEESKLVRMIAERASPERRTAPLPQRSESSVPTERGAPRFTGKLLEHGRAPYRQDPKEGMSYFARFETPRGERIVWGVDLERAFKESLTQPKVGDQIGLVPARRDAVKVNVPERDSEGKVSGQKSLDTHRNRWVVEKQAFFVDRGRAAQTLLNPVVTPQRAIKDHPELIGTYLQVKAAELAAKRLKNPTDRLHFVERVRSALAEAVARGEPLPKVRLKDKAPPRRSPRTPEPAQAR